MDEQRAELGFQPLQKENVGLDTQPLPEQTLGE